jgi:hypothetical protein
LKKQQKLSSKSNQKGSTNKKSNKRHYNDVEDGEIDKNLDTKPKRPIDSDQESDKSDEDDGDADEDSSSINDESIKLKKRIKSLKETRIESTKKLEKIKRAIVRAKNEHDKVNVKTYEK